MSKHHVLITITSLFITISGTVKAQELNAADTRALLAQGPWLTATGGGGGYRVWNSAGTICVKGDKPAAEGCVDSGTWTREGTEVCYQVEWHLKSVGMNKGCFYVSRLEGNDYDYEAVDADNGVRFWRFNVLSSD